MAGVLSIGEWTDLIFLIILIPSQILAPESITIVSVNDKSIQVSFTKPGGRTDGIELYAAFAVPVTPLQNPLTMDIPSCIANVTMNQTECTITRLIAGAKYKLFALSCSIESQCGTLSIWGRSQQVGFECTDSFEPPFEGLKFLLLHSL